jgi:hypothetical protein
MASFSPYEVLSESPEALFLYDGSGCHAAGIFPAVREIRNIHRGSAGLTRGSGRMRMKNTLGLSFLAALVAALYGAPAQAQQAPMTFFVTSVGKGNGADLGGLEGAEIR